MKRRKPKTMERSPETAERLKLELLADLGLMTAADLQGYWQQAKWPKPDLAKMADARPSNLLAVALTMLPPEVLVEASAQADPFGWLLVALDVSKWSVYCRVRRMSWLVRVWLATASQLRAEVALIFRAHGWGGTFQELRRDPRSSDKADDYYFAQLRHAGSERGYELLGLPMLGKRLPKARHEQDASFFRRLRRAKHGAGRRAGVALAEKYLVQHWYDFSPELPGLCFFSDPALDELLAAFGLSTGGVAATKQLRVRLGLIQAGARRHLIEEVISTSDELRFTGSMVTKPWVCNRGRIMWGNRQLWHR